MIYVTMKGNLVSSDGANVEDVLWDCCGPYSTANKINRRSSDFLIWYEVSVLLLSFTETDTSPEFPQPRLRLAQHRNNTLPFFYTQYYIIPSFRNRLHSLFAEDAVHDSF